MPIPNHQYSRTLSNYVLFNCLNDVHSWPSKTDVDPARKHSIRRASFHRGLRSDLHLPHPRALADMEQGQCARSHHRHQGDTQWVLGGSVHPHHHSRGEGWPQWSHLQGHLLRRDVLLWQVHPVCQTWVSWCFPWKHRQVRLSIHRLDHKLFPETCSTLIWLSLKTKYSKWHHCWILAGCATDSPTQCGTLAEAFVWCSLTLVI